MQYAPTRVRAKPARFHISTHAPTKNAPDFTLPNKDIPKTCPILDPNLRRGTFSGRMLLRPYTDTCKIWRVLGANPCRGTFLGRIQYAPTRVRKIPPNFRPKPSSRGFSGRMQYAPTRVHAKFDEFHIPAHDMTRNPAGFGLCHTTWRETRRVLDVATRHGAKPGGFWTLSHDMARNPAGFSHFHTTWRETWRVFNFATRHSPKPGGFFTLPHV